MTAPRTLTVFDAQAGAVTTVALADVAADIRRYELLGEGDDTAVTGSATEGGR